MVHVADITVSPIGIVQWNENRKVALVNRHSELRVGKLCDQRSLKGLIFVDMINMSAIELRLDEAQHSQECITIC